MRVARSAYTAHGPAHMMTTVPDPTGYDICFYSLNQVNACTHGYGQSLCFFNTSSPSQSAVASPLEIHGLSASRVRSLVPFHHELYRVMILRIIIPVSKACGCLWTCERKMTREDVNGPSLRPHIGLIPYAMKMDICPHVPIPAVEGTHFSLFPPCI